jgi:small subunit ribosomal protein S2
MLTNFQTILPRIQYFKDLAVRVDETPEEDRTGKDWFALNREYQKLRRNFAGITEMERLPGAVFVVDPKREELLVKEANRLKIPVLALTDTNCDPEVIDYVIPGNDDAIRAISLISRLVADAIIEGRGEEAPVEERPVPPVIEEAQINAEVQQTGTTNGHTGATTTATPAEATEEPPAPEGAGESEAQAEPEPVDEPEAPSEPEAAVESEAVEETEVDTHPEAEPESDTEDEPEVDSEPEGSTEVEVEAVEPEAAEPEAGAEPEAEESEDEAPEADEAPDDENEDTEEK